MTDKLPPNLLALFAARPPLRYLPHPDHAPEQRQSAAISGVAAFLPALKEQAQQPYEHTESWFERRIRIKAEKKEALEKHLTKDFEACTRSLTFTFNVCLADA
jgi:U1 small nuclear ribonucleoprotein